MITVTNQEEARNRAIEWLAGKGYANPKFNRVEGPHHSTHNRYYFDIDTRVGNLNGVLFIHEDGSVLDTHHVFEALHFIP